MFAPDPVEALFRHAQGDDDIDVVAVVLVGGVFEGGGNLIALVGVVIHQVGNFEHPTVRGADQLEPGGGVGALPFPQGFDDVLDFFDFVFGALAGVDVRDVQDGFLFGVEHLHDLVGVALGVEVVADVELLEVLVAVELFVVGVGDGFKTLFVVGVQHRFGIAAKVGSGHGDDVGFVLGHELADVVAQFVVGVGGNVVKLVYGDEAIVEGGNAEFIDGKAKGGVGADQGFGGAIKEFFDGIHFAAVGAGGIAQVPAGFYGPVGPKPKLAEGFVVEAGANGFFGNDDDRLFEALVL